MDVKQIRAGKPAPNYGGIMNERIYTANKMDKKTRKSVRERIAGLFSAGMTANDIGPIIASEFKLPNEIKSLAQFVYNQHCYYKKQLAKRYFTRTPKNRTVKPVEKIAKTTDKTLTMFDYIIASGIEDSKKIALIRELVK